MIQDETDETYASGMEKVFAKFLAPYVLSNIGRVCVLVAWAVGIATACYGITQLESNFSTDFFLPKESMTRRYIELFNKHFEIGFSTRIFIENENIDFSSEEV